MATTILTAAEIISGNNSISFPNSGLLSLTANKIESDTGASITSNASVVANISNMTLLSGGLATSGGVSFIPNSVANNLTVSGSVLGFVPGPPTNVTCVAGDGVVTVRFTPPVAKNGSEIVSYTVTSNPDNLQVTLAKAAAEANGIVVSNLFTNRPYTFTVQATNSTSLGVASQASSSIIPTSARVAAVLMEGLNTTFYFGDSVPIKVRMNIAVVADTTVQLSTNHPELFTNFPASVTIPAGQQIVTVTVPTVSNLVTYRQVSFTAAYNSSSVTNSDIVVKATDLVSVSTATYQYYSGTDVQLNIQLDNARSFGAGSVALTYSDASLLQGTIPSTVSFAADATVFSTTLKAKSGVLTSSKLTITVKFGDAVKTREIQIIPSV